MIAFLSQLTHCIAVTLMTCNDKENMEKFTGDSFRDLTRIARINDEMWSELFLANREALLREMDGYRDAFNRLYDTIKNNDRDAMRDMMRLSSARRKTFNEGENCEFKRKLPIPMEIKEQYPVTENLAAVKAQRDADIKAVFTGESDKFLLIIGPCSADNADCNGGEKGNNDPDGCNSAAHFDFGSLSCRHETEKNLGHSEITETPAESGKNGKKTVISGFTENRFSVFNKLESVFSENRGRNSEKFKETGNVFCVFKNSTDSACGNCGKGKDY